MSEPEAKVPEQEGEAPEVIAHDGGEDEPWCAVYTCGTQTKPD
jgi:hypothetical protein